MGVAQLHPTKSSFQFSVRSVYHLSRFLTFALDYLLSFESPLLFLVYVLACVHAYNVFFIPNS